ncbi:DUF2264 domain-containing protein [Lactiplantibacillus modestisalitolerans]|uniref:DUF2264 domain-containing protein n=1 Tax=Lactiplantibacillus modestisalitolerans TaxID=1457219 RepID=A0ABV5WSX3_9LACO|nr:DUF2264 domain-containing protein [Lactiplantibacillus modestisalitolerans]
MTQMQLNTAIDYQNLFEQINQPLRQHYHGKARIMFGSSGVGYGTRIAGVEGFARLLWGAGPAFNRLDASWQAELKAGILAGTDPESPDYWGNLHDRDQRMVEMPPIAFALWHHQHALWKAYDSAQQHQIATWLRQVFAHGCSDGNWQFFKILIYHVLDQLGVSLTAAEQADVQAAMAKIERCYVQDGWYQDSARGRMDYYTPFAFQYYGILYSVLLPDDPQSAVFRKRAREFATQFITFFAADGANVPFGRSLTYRYAAVAFWVAMVYGHVWPEKTAEMKGIINRNLRWWFKRPIFDESGLLTLGYGYAQLLMTEPYNSPTSPYWSNKIFLLLALPADDPYWRTLEAPLSVSQPTKLLAAPHLLAMSDKGHSILLNAGQPGPNYHALTNEKYFKFAYSSQFGFSVPRENQLKEEAVMDSMLGLQTCDTTMVANRGGHDVVEPGMFYSRNNVSDVVQTKQWVASTWRINDNMNVRTWLVGLAGWQIRLHRVTVKQPTLAYETGFGVANSPDEPGKFETSAHGSTFSGPSGFSGIVDLLGNSQQADCSIGGFPNTNLMTPEVVALPGRQTKLVPGEHWLVTGVYAHQETSYGQERWDEQPQVTLTVDHAQIQLGADIVTVKLS